MRANLPTDAVLLANERRLCLGMWSERRMFYDTNKFAPAFHATKRVGAEVPAAIPYAERERAQQALFDSPSAETLAQAAERGARHHDPGFHRPRRHPGVEPRAGDPAA